MNVEEAVKIACKEPTLVKAFSWIAVWESERAIRQALEQKRDANGKMWDTCFEHCFNLVLDSYKEKRKIK